LLSLLPQGLNRAGDTHPLSTLDKYLRPHKNPESVYLTRMGFAYYGESYGYGKRRKRILRGFLVDGAIIPGSSGSPVVLPPVSLRNLHGRLQIQTFPLLLLGIIAESRYAPLITPTTDYLSFSGLGLAFDAQTIMEPIELFFV
jgi:hypothetical protein